MIRRGALTLGAVLMLGALTGARGDDLSGPVVVTANPSFLPSRGEVFPRLPENWSDLPVRFKVSESLEYNSNVLSNAGNAVTNGAPAIGDFQSLTTYGASAKPNWSGQQLFADATYGMTRYLRNARLDNYSYFLDAGVNWAYTSRCSGTLVAVDSVNSSLTGPISSVPQSPSTTGQPTSINPITGQPTSVNPTTGLPTTVNPITGLPTSSTGQPSFSTLGQQVGSGFINIVTTTSLNETASCRVSGDYSAIFNSGVTRLTNSTAPNKPNDYRSVFVSAGITYSVAATNTLSALVTITGTDYTNRSAAQNALGLVNNITQDQFNLTYTKQIDPNISVTASIGLVGSTNSGFSLSAPSRIEPQYSASATWAATPKVSLLASVSQSVSAPQSVIGNAQLSRSASLSLSYLITPKMTFSTGAAISHSESAFTQTPGVIANGALGNLANSQTTNSVYGNLSYRMTPFLAANLSCAYSRSVQQNLTTPQSLVMLNVSYNPF